MERWNRNQQSKCRVLVSNHHVEHNERRQHIMEVFAAHCTPSEMAWSGVTTPRHLHVLRFHFRLSPQSKCPVSPSRSLGSFSCICSKLVLLNNSSPQDCSNVSLISLMSLQYLHFLITASFPPTRYSWESLNFSSSPEYLAQSVYIYKIKDDWHSRANTTFTSQFKTPSCTIMCRSGIYICHFYLAIANIH